MAQHYHRQPTWLPPDADRRRSRTRSLLAGGAVAGPIYVSVGLIEALTRRGFSLAHHDLSLLSNGRGGWIHSGLLVVTGLLVIAGAAGVQRAATGSKWAGRLLAGYGAGLCGAGVFRADPMSGFPPGTAAGRPNHVSWHGNLHFITAALGFLAFILACIVLSRLFAHTERRGRSRWTLITGVFFAAALAGIATGSGNAAVVVTFGVAVVMGFSWLTWLSLSLREDLK
jgi:hypothetical membrane protein